MRKQTLNQFEKGLVSDLNPISTPATVLVEARNIDFVTVEGNQFIMQKRSGNDPEVFEEVTVTLADGFKPVAVKELNNIAYIISYNESTNEGEIGTFPSPDWTRFEWVVDES